MENVERDVPDNYSTFHQSVEVGPMLVVHTANGSTSKATKIV